MTVKLVIKNLILFAWISIFSYYFCQTSDWFPDGARFIMIWGGEFFLCSDSVCEISIYLSLYLSPIIFCSDRSLSCCNFISRSSSFLRTLIPLLKTLVFWLIVSFPPLLFLPFSSFLLIQELQLLLYALDSCKQLINIL